MSDTACRNLDKRRRRRSPRLKNTHVAYHEDCKTDFCIKTETIDPEDIASPSTLEINVASIADNDADEDFQNVTLKDLRTWHKAKSQKDQKTISEGPGFKKQTQCVKLENERPKDEVDLDEPLIILKQKRQKTSPSKAKRKVDTRTSSPDAARAEDTTSEGHGTSAVQTCPLGATLHDSMQVKLDLKTAIDHSHTEDMVREDISCAQLESTIFYKIETEDRDTYLHDEVGVSSERNSFEHSSIQLHQVPVEDDECGQQPDFITQPAELNASDHACELTQSVETYLDGNAVQIKQTNTVSLLDFINEVSNHQKLLDDITNSDVDKSSGGSEFLVCSVNLACNDVDKDEYLHPGVQSNTPENIKTVEESSVDEFNTEVGSKSAVMQSDLCRSTGKNCTSLEEVVQMKAEGQLTSVVCHGLGSEDLLLHMNAEQAASVYNSTFDKALDLVTNFDTQDGRLESIVYDALNNHVPRKNSEAKAFVVVPDTVVIQSPPIEAHASYDGQLLLVNNMVKSPKDISQLNDGQLLLVNNMVKSPKDNSQLNDTMNGDICTSVTDQGSIEGLDFQHQYQACVDMEKTGHVTSESSSNPEETREILAGASNSTATSQGIDGQNKLEAFIDEGLTEEHTPKKLLSKRKIMSPTSQEKLCNALTGIDLCGVQRLKRKIHLEDCDKSKRTLPQTADKHDQSMRLKFRSSLSSTSKGVLKSTEFSSPRQTDCACMRSSSVLLDTRKAVDFSQRQMHDIENIAANLIRSLKHMRSIVDESLSSEAHSFLPNFNTAEIRAASEDALEVERTTRKWLTIMNKDCSRFCKILTLEGKKAVSHPEMLRKRRKITFADEAGGTLCHVKVFNDGQSSVLSECKSEL